MDSKTVVDNIYDKKNNILDFDSIDGLITCSLRPYV